jgi:hypothetical protein
MRDPVRIGDNILLRACFTDSEGDPIEASGVTVSLFEPGLDPSSDPATVSGLSPTYIGEGVFEVEVTASAPGGTWIDQWTGTILGTQTSVNLSYGVLDSGAIYEYPKFGLYKNNLVEITLDSSISSSSGTSLLEDFVSRFTTEYTPLWSSIRKVRLEAGGLLGNILDDTINLAILEASLEADTISFAGVKNNKLFYHARREYVTCRAGQMLASNILASGGILKSKLLSDFRVDYDTQGLLELLDKLGDRCKRWESQVMSGGETRYSRRPRGVVKGELDPDRPKVGRLWTSHQPGEKPIGNTKGLPVGSRRRRRGYVPRNRGTKKDEW